MARDDERLRAGEPAVTLSRWQLSSLQWEMLTESLSLEGYPTPIRVSSVELTDVEAAQLRAEANTELSRRGLIRAGRVEADLEAALRLLHSPVCWVVSMWLPHETADQAVRVIAARTGAVGVCARQHPDQPGATLLEIIPATGLAAAVVGKLPPHPPGRSPAVTVPRQQRAEPNRGIMVTSSPARTSAERASAAATAILDQPHAREGQIVATVRDPSGRVRRSEVLYWYDNPDGRYLVTLSHPPGGPEWLAVHPADPQRLGESVQRLLASLQPMRG